MNCKNGHLLSKENIYIRPDGYKECRICRKIKTKTFQENNPWYSHYNAAQQRCENRNRPNYKYYGNRGIKFNLSVEDIKCIWHRDKAYLLNKPSLDRKDDKKGYTINNCRFIEIEENNKRKQPLRGIANPNAKLTEKQVKKIRKLYKSQKYLQTELGKMFNVTSEAICLIVHRKNWRYLKCSI